METRLINSQLVSRRDIKVWFWDGQREFQGECVALGENGVWMEIKVRVPVDGTIPNVGIFLQLLRKQLKDKVVTVELTSPKIKGEVKVKLSTVGVLSQKKEMLSVVATYEAPPDPKLVKVLKEPVVTTIVKKPGPPPAKGPVPPAKGPALP
ncbi:MAG: hypothetical protein HYY17_05085 [Planctomycetes bacterium]|nr:hypothetical protein [Planctomycetota bacterium]